MNRAKKTIKTLKPTWVVCIKQVPRDPVFKKIGDTFHIAREKTEGILNPHDRFALNFAMQLKNKAGGEIVVITMGPPQAEEALREGIAYGADKAILLSDPNFAGADTLATAYTLAAGIRKLNSYALILCGAQTLDSDTGQVGPQLAEFLDLPMVAYVDDMSYKQDALRVERRMDGLHERLLVPFPALITVTGGQQKATALSLGSVEEAFTDIAISRWSQKDLDLAPSRIGFNGSATMAKEYAYWNRSRSGETFQGKPGEAADKIIAEMIKHNILGG